MATDLHERTTEHPGILELVARLQGNMRLYDELMPQFAATGLEAVSADEALEGVDLQEAIEQENAAVAFAALNKLAIDHRLAQLNQRLDGLQGGDDILTRILNRGKKFTVRALHPEQEKIDAFWLDDAGRHSTPSAGSAGKSHTERTGSLLEINLNPASGGYIQLANEGRSQMYQAVPLYDREDGYKPLFEVRQDS